MAEVPLKEVELQADVYMVCLQQALSSEKLEVMGLLIGDIECKVARIMAVTILTRSDKQKDRVEISSQQMLKATEEAERLTEELGRQLQVLGWYHSHPHITVNPSRVDVGTQAIYQTMDARFVGLIVSVFSESKESKEQEISVICFQSHNNKAIEIPLKIIATSNISNTCLKAMSDSLKTLIQEEDEMAEACENEDILTTIHNIAVKTRTLVRITDIITKPLVITFQARIALNKLRVAYLQRQLEELQIMDECKPLC